MPSANEENHHLKAKVSDTLSVYNKYIDPEQYFKYDYQHIQQMKLLFNQDKEYTHVNYGRIRFFHAIPYPQSIDLYLNGIRVFRNIPYKSVSKYLTLPKGKYQIDLYPSGQLHTVLISKKVQIKEGSPYTLIAAGNAKTNTLFAMEENHVLPLRETKLNCLNLNPDSAGIDIAVTGGDTIFSNLAYTKPSPYLGLTPMTIEFLVKCSTSKELILDPFSVKLHADELYTMGIISSGTAHSHPEIVFI